MIQFNKLENNGNANFNSNGENHFIDSLISSISEAKDVCIFDIGANTGDYSSILLNGFSKSGRIFFHISNL